MKTITRLVIAAALGLGSLAWGAEGAPPPRRALGFKEVKVGGELRTRLARSFQRMHDERYQRDVLFTKTRDPKWPGDMEGRTALALTLLAQGLGVQEAGIDELVGAFPEYFNEKGYLGEIHLPDAVDEQQLSGHGWVLRALCEYYLWRRKPETKAQIQGIVDGLILETIGLHGEYPLDPADRVNKGKASGEKVVQIGKWRLSSDIGCDFIFFDGAVQAYAVTRDPRLIPVIDELAHLFMEMDLTRVKAQTHATLSGVRGLIRYYELCGRKELLERAEQTFQIYLEEGCTENYENYNWFGRPEWTEPCAIIDSYLVANQLWQHTGESDYLEDAQWIYFNGICATQRSNGGFGLNNCTGAEHPFIFTKSPEAHWCCTMRGGEGLARAVCYSAFADDAGVWLACFMNSEIMVRLPSGLLSLVQESEYPFVGGAKVTVRAAPAKDCEIRLFSPSFVKPIAVLVNGVATEAEVKRDFFVLRRRWKEGDIVEFEFDLKLGNKELHNMHSITNCVAIHDGPLLLAARCQTQPQDQKELPQARSFGGELQRIGPRRWKAGEKDLQSIYHLLDPAYDQTEGSWRQMLFE